MTADNPGRCTDGTPDAPLEEGYTWMGVRSSQMNQWSFPWWMQVIENPWISQRQCSGAVRYHTKVIKGIAYLSSLAIPNTRDGSIGTTGSVVCRTGSTSLRNAGGGSMICVAMVYMASWFGPKKGVRIRGIPSHGVEGRDDWVEERLEADSGGRSSSS
jgi:hypothetical protein